MKNDGADLQNQRPTAELVVADLYEEFWPRNSFVQPDLVMVALPPSLTKSEKISQNSSAYLEACGACCSCLSIISRNP